MNLVKDLKYKIQKALNVPFFFQTASILILNSPNLCLNEINYFKLKNKFK